MRTFKITTFAGVTCTTGTPEELTLEQLAARLTSPPTVRENRLSGDAWVPGWFENNQRLKKCFDQASCLVYDFDGAEHKALSAAEMLSVVTALQSLRVVYVLHTTYRGGLRVVLPLAQDVSDEMYKQLFDRTALSFGTCKPDIHARGAERLNFLPQVPDALSAAEHISEAQLSGELLGSVVLASSRSAPAVGGSIFSDVKLAKVRVGSRGAVETLAELTALLAASESKQEDLNRWVFALAKSAAARGDDQQAFADALWPAAEAGLKRNSNPVENWQLALSTCERAIKQAYEKHAAETAEAVAAALAKIPENKVKHSAKLIHEGKLSEAGAVLGKYVGGALTVDALLSEVREAVEASNGITGVPEALETMREALAANAPASDWQKNLRFNLNGKGEQYDASEENLMTVFTQHPDCVDLFEQNVRAVLPARYRRDAPWGARAGEQYRRADTRVFNWTRDVIGLQKPRMATQNAVLDPLTDEAPEVDPFLDYLRALPPPALGQDRLSTLLVEHFGVEDTAYNRSVTRKTFIAACARADQPGCMLDSILVLYSPTGGQGKTKFWQQLLPDPQWCGSIKNLSEREVPQKLQRYVFGLVDEIDKWAGRKAAGELKEFLTETSAAMRAAYAHNEKVYERRGVLVGSTNVEKFTHDVSGARRYWVLEVTKACDFEAVRAQRDQVWAEAWAAYQAKEAWWFTAAEQAELKPAHNEVLQMREPTAESEAVLELMADASEWGASAHASRAGREGKIGLARNQMINGYYLTCVSEMQIEDFFQVRGWHGKNVKHALEAAGLRRTGKRSTTWALPLGARERHEAEAAAARAEKTAGGREQASVIMNRFAAGATGTTAKPS